jgi:hypothetical protein
MALDLAQYYSGAKSYLADTQAKSHVTVARAVQIAEVGAGAFLGSYLTTKLGGAQGTMVGFGAAKAPLTLLAGAACFGAAAFDLGGEHNQDLANLGTGFVAAYAAGVGRAAGLGHFSFATGATPSQRHYHQFVSGGRRAA